MAFSTLKAFEPSQLGATAGTIYTVPSAPAAKTVNFKVRLVNTDSSAQAVTLYAVPASGTAGDENACWDGTLTAKQVLDVDIPVMKSGDILQGLAGAADKVTIHHLGGLLDQ